MLSFEAVYMAHVAQVRTRIAQRVSNSADVDDLVSETMIAAWRALPRYEERGTPITAWLGTIAHNTLVSYYRRQRPSSAPLDGIEASDNPALEAETRIEFASVRAAIAELGERERMILLARFEDDREYADIASELGVGVPTARVLCSRAIQRLRARIAAPRARARR